MRFYEIREDTSPPYTGFIDGRHTWGLPGVERCPTCRSGGGIDGLLYPCVDLSSLPAHELKKLSNPWPVPREEFNRLRELVRPFVPDWARLLPGAQFGPIRGKGSGHFGQLFVFYSCSVLVRREALEQLQAAGLRGLRGCPIQARFREKNPPEFLDLQLELRGQLHQDCLLPDLEGPCPACGYQGFSRPKRIVLDAASLPSDLDVFQDRKGGIVIASERFVDTVKRLNLGGATFNEVEVR